MTSSAYASNDRQVKRESIETKSSLIPSMFRSVLLVTLVYPFVQNALRSP